MTKPKLKAILYDFDDTLIDWSGCTRNWRDIGQRHISLVFDYVKANVYPLADRSRFSETFHKLTFQAWTEAKQTLRTPHIGQLLMDTCTNLGVPRRILKINELMDAYEWKAIDGVVPFPETLDTLQYIDKLGIKQGMITNAYSPMSMRWREVEAYGLDQFLVRDGCISAADVGYLKPDPRIFEAALERLQVQPNEVVFIGDSREADIAGAQNFGMKAILRVNAYTTRTAMPSVFPYKIVPDAEITSLKDMVTHFDDWYDGWRENTPKTSFSVQSLEESRP